MCNQVQSVTLQTAVLMQVKEFAQNNTPFSVHDITNSLRHKVNDGELEIPEVEEQGSNFRFKILHTDVKDRFIEMLRAGVFDPDFTLTRSPTLVNNMYWVYTPAIVNGSAVNGQTTPTTTQTPTPSAATNANDVEDRIKTYLSNCAVRNFRPTLKQVQSAIKRADASTGWSCETLKSYITSILGYIVVDDPDALSRAQVATV